jgi:hypothetical protein
MTSDSTFQTRRRVLQTTGIVLGTTAVGSMTAAAQDGPETYSADLSNEDVSGDVNTEASGIASFEIDRDAEEIHYTIDVEWLCDVNAAHIHLGDTSDDGEVIAWLYPEAGGEPQVREGRTDGTLVEGTLTADDLTGPLEGDDPEAVAETLGEEGAYVNVTTERYPDGELRGQIEPAEGEPPTDGAADDADEEPEEPDEEPEEPDDEPDEDDDPEPTDDPDAIGDALTLADYNVAVGRGNTDEEYIELENTSDQTLELGGYVVTDRDDGGTAVSATFPDGFTLDPGARVRVTTGDGEATDSEIFMGSGRNVWNQDGDVVVVQAPDGAVVFEQQYGNPPSSILSTVISHVSSLVAT